MMDNNKPSFVNRTEMTADKNYVLWLDNVKRRYKESQIKASVKVNSELLSFYWSLGQDIVSMNIERVYGKNIMANISMDLQKTFPGQKGFSTRNLYFMKQWYLFYTKENGIFDQAGQKSSMSEKSAYNQENVTLHQVGQKSSMSEKPAYNQEDVILHQVGAKSAMPEKPKDDPKDGTKDGTKELSKRQRLILEIISAEPSLSAKAISEKISERTSERISVSDRTIESDLAQLKKRGVLSREGGKTYGKWVIKTKD